MKIAIIGAGIAGLACGEALNEKGHEVAILTGAATPVAACRRRCCRGDIAWAARNSAKPGRSGPEAWVVQAGPDW